MGVDAEDVDGDGCPELFVTNFASEYNTLYRNLDGRNFQDVSAGRGSSGTACRTSAGAAPGRLRPRRPARHAGRQRPRRRQPGRARARRGHAGASPKVWRNVGNCRVPARAGRPARSSPPSHVARGAAFGDLDNDGDIDVVVSLMDRRPAILLNESASRSWLRLGAPLAACPPAGDRRPECRPCRRPRHPPPAQGGRELSLGQ